LTVNDKRPPCTFHSDPELGEYFEIVKNV
jgi:hypothetical protein